MVTKMRETALEENNELSNKVDAIVGECMEYLRILLQGKTITKIEKSKI